MNFEPHDYQAYAIDYIEAHPVAAVLLDMGLGKTVISLTAIADLLFDNFDAHRVLVVAPLRVARDTWPAEIEKWAHLQDLTYTVAVGSTRERKAALMVSADITIINRENLSWLIESSGFPFDKTTGTFGSKGSCVVAADLVSNVEQLHTFLFGSDENYTVSDKVKEISAKITNDTGVTAKEQ